MLGGVVVDPAFFARVLPALERAQRLAFLFIPFHARPFDGSGASSFLVHLREDELLACSEHAGQIGMRRCPQRTSLQELMASFRIFIVGVSWECEHGSS